MGSQTLEILRQGVWASLTGGWFYDPHQNLFCNTVHLYIWLFLLCLPFSVYLYFPPATLGWVVYCTLVALLFSGLKLLNHSLHHMYDTTECVVVQSSTTPGQAASDAKPREEEGIELQMLHMDCEVSDNESVTSLEYHKPNNSTIDLKVDVHRKNSSESSIEDAAAAKTTDIAVTNKSDLCVIHGSEAAGPVRASGRRSRSRPNYKREQRRSSLLRQLQASERKIEEMSSEERPRKERSSKHEDNIAVNLDHNGLSAKVGCRLHECPHRSGSPDGQHFNEWIYKEWFDRNIDKNTGKPYRSSVTRYAGPGTRDSSEQNVGPPSPKKKAAHRRRYAHYPNESCTKSAMALASSRPSNLRRNSNSTMSTIQLPLLNSTAQLVSHMRRHSNTGDAGIYPPTGSVELGAYMMEKADGPSRESDGSSKGKSLGVRRIRSAALEIGCPPPSVSNLSPHPNSAETIGGQVLKNPKNAVLPPPSKSLMRNPHLNLYTNNETGEGCSYPYLNYGSEIVYPIAEISDEMQTSQKESDLDSSGDSYSDYDDENGNTRHQFSGFDWDSDPSPTARSSDSDYENNGSRSPLLDRACDIRIVRSRHHPDCKKHICCERHVSKPIQTDLNVRDWNKRVRLKKTSVSDIQNNSKCLTEYPKANSNKSSETYKSNCNLKSDSDNFEGRKRVSEPVACKSAEYFDKASASSKDLLIEKSSVESNENPLEQNTGDKKKEQIVGQKPWDHEISNSSSSSEVKEPCTSAPGDITIGKAGVAEVLEKGVIIVKPHTKYDNKSGDEHSVYSIDWLFEESKQTDESHSMDVEKCARASSPVTCTRAVNALGETSTNVQKNLGAIPKQIKNMARSRASSQKENKKRDLKQKDIDDSQNDEMNSMDAVEAQAALVQGLECLFAATNANTVVMPPLNRDERPRSHRQHSENRRDSHKTRKRSIEEVAQTSTNTLLPTSMPLLAAFLNSRVDFPHIPICLPESTPGQTDVGPMGEQTQRFRPLMDRNHRNRVRKIKRSTRQRNNPPPQSSVELPKDDKPPSADNTSNSSSVHFATSFNDTTDGAIHCFLDEYGNWMSYTFDKNCSGRIQAQPIPVTEKDDKNTRCNQVKPLDSSETAPDNVASVGSCGSLVSEATNAAENVEKPKRTGSIDQSYNSSNQGSNNPLLASSNNLSSVVPINTNNANKRFYVFDGGTGGHTDQPRSPVAYVTDSLLEQIEAERQSRMGLPSMHINFLMSRNNPPVENMSNANMLQIPLTDPIGDELTVRNKIYKLIDEITKSNLNKPKSYYKFKLMKCWEIKVTLDRLKLMALFDRNITFRETFVSIILAIAVSVLGSMVLNLGFYKDIYAFWFCFIMAGSQYSLLKSVQPDSASPVHGFNKMVVYSRPVYFCLCSAILYGVHCHLEQYAYVDEGEYFKRTKRSIDPESLSFYGLTMHERDFLYLIQETLSKFLLFFPLAFSLGLFPQVNTFMMYLLEQIDMHVFGGNAACSLNASVYCVVRSMLAVGALYGFAYSGLIEAKKSQHILFSIFCGLLVPISYHLSRSASDYTLIWNLIKKHLLPPELYVIHNPECSAELEKGDPNTLSEQSKKNNNSESNISKQNSIGSSASKINFSSETNISKIQKRSQTSSVSSLKFDPRGGDTMNSSSSLKVDAPTESGDQSTKPENAEKAEEDMDDPLPRKLQATVNARLKNDVIVCTFLALVVFGIHCTTVFTTLRPELNKVLWMVAAMLGWTLHYLVPQLRKQQPWLCLAAPVLRQHEHAQFEVSEPARVMCFEKAFVYLCFLERNVLYPAVLVSAATEDSPAIVEKFGPALGAFIVCVCSLKCLRNAYSEPDAQYLILIFAVLLFRHDFGTATETFLVDYFITAIIFNKVYEFLLKIQFVVTYIAPWQITWGSAFHAFAQPFSVPHSAMLFLQAALSALLSSPLTPALGSAIFMTSYVRPVKFWERDYNTKRVDQSNTRLSSQLERNLGADDNNLNSIFYEHLTRSLQHYLCGDLMLGRWGLVQQGDCFVLASDYLNCLVHIVELGNGLVSFQLRGLEFRGTYCQQREVEAISEGPEESSAGWWCAGRLLSPGAAFSLRWLAWQLASAKYVLEGYSVSDNSAVSMLQMFDFRKVLITYYVKSIIYYTIQSSKLEEWLSSPTLVEALRPVSERAFVDLDPIFNVNLDEDYDFRASGITRARFCAVYHEWIAHCSGRRDSQTRRRASRAVGRDSPLVTLCFALSLVGRRALHAASHLSASSVEFFLYGLHSLFKGDFRITCARDEWVFTDMSLLHSVLAPAVRMALKLHQDHFMFPEEYCSSSALYSAVACHSQRLVICHEAAPAWRYNVLRGAPHLLALRHVMDEGNDDYKIIMLNKRHLGFRVIKLNRECVRGLWAGQQQELVYLRNRNPERGSIQNAKQALRNIINSSCDQPIGYPIYVSPLTTSYADTSEQLSSLIGGPISVRAIKTQAIALWRRIRRRCGEGCSSGGGACDAAAAEAGAARAPPTTPRHALHLSRTSLAGTRGSLASAGKPTSSTLASLAGLLREHSHERTLEDAGAAAYTTIRESSAERRRRSEERLSEGGSVRRERSRPPKDSRQAMCRRERAKDGSRRPRHERARPASFRVLSERGNASEEGVEMQALRQQAQGSTGGWDDRSWREQPRRAASAKIAPPRPPTPDSSLEDLTLNPSGLDQLSDCKIIFNRSARLPPSDIRRFVQESTSKDFAKLSKDIKHERESYRDLAGKYSELPSDGALALKEPPKYSDLSGKESSLRLEKKTAESGSKEPVKKDSVKGSKEKSKDQIKTKIKRSDSGKAELKVNVSIGCKVLIIDPQGVYDCINLGRRIDVQWPSEYQRERGGRNYWGNWVPLQGMDGQVVHRWTPNHRDPKLRSHVDKTILLVQLDDRFVPIAENCVHDLGDEV